MCLSIPAKIIEVNGEMAKASIGGSIIDVGLQLIENISIGDYVLVHTGFALEKIDEKEALEQIQLLKDLSDNPDHQIEF